MKITKYKKVGKNRYNIYFNDNMICIYEDIIFKYDLLLKKEIDIDTLDKIIDDNKYYEAYYLLLNYIEIKMRNKNELISYLKRKNIDDKYIEFSINKIEGLGLLNEKKYIECFINDKINLNNDGPYKIKKQLIDSGLNENDIDEYLSSFDDSIWDNKLEKIIEKKLVMLKNKSYYILINKLKTDLFNMGYDKDMIDFKLSNIEYNNDNITKEYERAIKKYKDDKHKIINYLLRKGYSYEEINNLFDN